MASIAFLLLLSAFLMAAAQQRQSNINLGSSLTPTTNSSWLSPSGLYAFGFYKQGSGYAVGIFLAGIPQKTVVWTAHRDDPPVSSNHTLLFTRDGRFVLQTTEGQETPIVDSPEPAAAAYMLDSGNFVLYNSDQQIIWQSFGNATTTLLPGQRLLSGVQMFSSVSESDQSTGIFRLKMQIDGNLVQYPVDTQDAPEYAYWSTVTYRAGDNVTLNLDDDGHLYLLNSAGIIIKDVIPGGNPKNETIYLMKIDADGIFRLYSHQQSQNGNWSVVWASTTDKCAPKGLCGLNGFCVLNGQDAECRCLPGFANVSEGDWTSGCERNFTAESCRSNDGSITCTIIIQEVDNTTWADDAYSNVLQSNKEGCIAACLEDSICDVAMFINGMCKKQKLPLRFGRRLLTNSNIALVKVAILGSANVRKKEDGLHGMRLGVTIGGVVSLIVLIPVSLWCYFRWRSHCCGGKNGGNKEEEILSEEKNHELPLFSFSSIQTATGNFADQNMLGRGGFGPVYKGILVDGREIAVKRLSQRSAQGLKEFKSEVTLISKLQHRNLVKLLGCCIEKEERLLIYEYLPNKSLEVFLFDATKRRLLDWKIRFCIIEGIAQGLLYLHKYSMLKIIHRDLKTGNILLDANMNPKISDFGTARIFGDNESHTNTKRLAGTFGYMPPEYAMQGLYSEKSNVFSFGVMLLEIVSGMKTNYQSDRFLNLLAYAWDLWKDGRGLELIDSALDETYSTNDQVLRCVQVGLLCVQESAADRPIMSDVVSMLSNELMTLPTPKQPAFFNILEGNDAKTPENPRPCDSNSDIRIDIEQNIERSQQIDKGQEENLEESVVQKRNLEKDEDDMNSSNQAGYEKHEQ